LEARTRAALEALEREELPAKGRAREFHYRLSEILRGYLGERFQVDALECTSGELVTRLGTASAPGLGLGGLSAFLEASDLVKFARAPATVEACAGALQFAQRVVVETTPAPPPTHDTGPHISAA
jgi:hypothetical protein